MYGNRAWRKYANFMVVTFFCRLQNSKVAAVRKLFIAFNFKVITDRPLE
jgi:hypothetical protein